MTPDSSNISQRYLGDQGREYYELGFSSETEIGRLYQSRHFRPYCSEEKTVLDVGCADGFFLHNLPAKQRLGVEVNPKAIQICQERSIQNNCPITIYRDIREIQNHSVDVVLSNHCLEHIPEPFQILQEVRRVLKPDGVFLLVVPFDDWRQRGHRTWRSNDLNQHLYTWCPLNLGNLVTEAGFHIRELALKTSTWSPRLNWIHRSFGPSAYSFACHFLSFVLNRREIFCRAYPTA